MRKLLGITLVLSAFCLMCLAHPAGAPAGELEDILALADKIQNETPGIQLTVWTDQEKYRVSDKVVFGFTADKDCYLSIINIGTSGRATLLFPNKWQPNNRIEKDKEQTIPPQGSEYVFKIAGPVGIERIKVIASLEPILQNVASLQQELKEPPEQGGAPGGATGGPFVSLKNPRSVLKDIGIALSQTDASKWSTAEMQFKVEDAGAGPQTPPAPAPAPAQ